MKIYSYVFILLLILIGITFSLLNAQRVVLHYYFGQKEWPFSFFLVLSFGFGIFVGWLSMLVRWLSLKSHDRKLSKQLKVAQQELDNLRIVPIKENETFHE